MRYLTLINNQWLIKKNPLITQEEKDILANLDSSNIQLRKTTAQNIKNRSLEIPSNEDINIAQALYDQHKLSNSQLIGVDISLPLGNGIINCLLNNEHKQIRF